MSGFTKYFPTTIFQDRFGACPVLTLYANVPASSVDLQLIAAVPGKFIRIVSLCALCVTAVNNAGAIASPGIIAGRMIINAPSVDAPMLVMPFNPGGYFDSTQGTRVNIDTDPGGLISLTIRYIVFGV